MSALSKKKAKSKQNVGPKKAAKKTAAKRTAAKKKAAKKTAAKKTAAKKTAAKKTAAKKTAAKKTAAKKTASKETSSKIIHNEEVYFRWQNFRGFDDTGTLGLCPLTVVVGSNNSGKSSLLAPLLLLKQTLESLDATSSLITKGDLVQVGLYKDYVFCKESERSVVLGLWPHTHLDVGGIPDFPGAGPGGAQIHFVEDPDTKGARLEKLEVFDWHRRLFLSRTRTSDGYDLEGPIVGYMKSKGASEEFIRQLCKKSSTDRFLFKPVWYGWDEQENSNDAVLKENAELLIFYNHAMSRVEGELLRALGGMSYIGPLREQPRRFYEHTGEHPQTVGPRGEYAYEILFRNRKELSPQLSDWMQKFDFAQDIVCREDTTDVFTVELDVGGVKCNLADLGFGVSQLLPILVEGLGGGGCMLVKQPEIHLNPKQQCRLADLFSALVSAGRRLYVETHSEHFLTGLRRAIAEGKISSDSVALYYVERQAPRSTVRRVNISDNGHIDSDDWPDGFFEDSLREAFALARAQAARIRPARGGSGRA